MRIEDVTPPPPATVLDYIFEFTEAEIAIYSANGKLLVEVGTANDFYGEGTAVQSAISKAKEEAENYGPGVEVRVTKVVRQIRMRPSHDRGFYDKAFVEFEGIKSGCERGLPRPVESIVWSSNNP